MDKKYAHILLEEGDILELANRREKLIECEHERAAWKAEAMAALKLLDSAMWNDADYVAYLATRVKDTP